MTAAKEYKRVKLNGKAAFQLSFEAWRWQPTSVAFAAADIEDLDGTVTRGSRGEICDFVDCGEYPCDGEREYVVVDFPQTGPTLCSADELAFKAVTV